MKKLILFSFLLPLFSISSFAQLATLTGTIQDPNGQLWINAVVRADFQNAPGRTPPFNWSGGTYSTTVQTTTDNNGTFSLQVAPNSQIVPSGTSWLFTICPNVTIGCSTVQLSIIGNADISSNINTQIAAPSVSIATMPKAYSDSEIKTIPAQGGNYYNVTAQAPKYYDGSSFHFYTGTNLGMWTVANQLFVSTSPSNGAWQTLPSCNASNSVLQFNISSGLFTCINTNYAPASGSVNYAPANPVTGDLLIGASGTGGAARDSNIAPGNVVVTNPATSQLIIETGANSFLAEAPPGIYIGHNGSSTYDVSPGSAGVFLSNINGATGDIAQLMSGSTMRASLAFSGECNTCGAGTFRHTEGRLTYDPANIGVQRFQITTLSLSATPTETAFFDWVPGTTTISDKILTPGSVYTAAAPAVSAGQVGFGGTVAAASNCNQGGTLTSVAGCLVINVAGTTHYTPYF